MTPKPRSPSAGYQDTRQNPTAALDPSQAASEETSPTRPPLTCTNCGHTGPETDFSKQASKTTGRSSWCRPCHRAKNQATRDTLRYGTLDEDTVRRLLDKVDFNAEGPCPWTWTAGRTTAPGPRGGRPQYRAGLTPAIPLWRIFVNDLGPWPTTDDDKPLDAAHLCHRGYEGCVYPLHIRPMTRAEHAAHDRATSPNMTP